MRVMEATRLAYRELKPEIGAEVLAGKEALLGGEHAADIRELMERRGVLLFPQVHFTDEEMVSFTRTLGDYVPDRQDGAPVTISLDPAGGRQAEYIKSSMFWHFDGFMNPVPVLASLLCPRVLSATGGDTEFANTYAAYEALPDERKAQIDGMQAVHTWAAAQISVEPEPSYESFRGWADNPRTVLPLVWKHRSGRRSLVVGNTALAVLGLDPLESLDLLVFLRDWATQEQFRYSHKWSLGNAVMWDNTGTLHRVTPYAADSGRRMVRTKLAGEEPFS